VNIRTADAEVTISTPAKLNLYFEVLAKRPDGFHEIETLMVPIDCYDTLVFCDTAVTADRPAGSPIELVCDWATGMRLADGAGAGSYQAAPDLPPAMLESLPTGSGNIVVRAVELLRQRTGTEKNGAIRLVKRIPSAAGLGGGSSDAAAALVAANLAWQVGWSRRQLADLAAELGSDVPFFLQNGSAICRGRGELIEPVTGLGKLHFVVVRPPVGLSTAEVYRSCQPSKLAKSCNVKELVCSLRLGDWRRLPSQLLNALEPPARKLSPWIERLSNEFARLDCLAAQMSGSGTSYFGVCRSARQARIAAAKLRSRKLGLVFTATSIS